MKSSFPPLKRFGQNFLVDKNIVSKVLCAVGTTKQDDILEIGPGQGALTHALAKKARTVSAVEIDRGLCRYLASHYKDNLGSVDILCGDILKFDLKKYARKKKIKSFKVVANLPYYITTPSIEYLFRNLSLIKDIFIMVQKEVAERMIASPKTKSYGSFSCFVNYFTEPAILFHIKGTSFYPAPRVDSCFVRLRPRQDPKGSFGVVKSEELLFKVIRAAFGQRRKRLYGALARLAGKERLKTLTPVELLKKRAEELTLVDFVQLSNLIQKG